MKLYREVVLKEKVDDAGFVPLDGIVGLKPATPTKPAATRAAETREEVGSFGD